MQARTRSLFLLAFVAACSDPGPTTPTASPPTKASPLWSEGGQPTVSYDELGIPTYPPVQGNSAAFNYCLNNLLAANWRVTADRGQTLRWDDPSGRPRAEIFNGRVRIYFRFWAGTYAGQPTRCIMRDSTRFNRTAYEYNILISQPSMTYTSSYSWCWGNPLNPQGAGPDCTNHPAQITQWVMLPFGRNCYLGGNYARGEEYHLGGLFGPNQDYPMTWQWQLYAVDPQGRHGFWTVDDYGGNESPGTNGWAPWGGGRDVCSRYDPDQVDYNTYWQHRGGTATWGYPEG